MLFRIDDIQNLHGCSPRRQRPSEGGAFDFDEHDPGILNIFRPFVAGASLTVVTSAFVVRRRRIILGRRSSSTERGFDSINVNPRGPPRTMGIVYDAGHESGEPPPRERHRALATDHDGPFYA